MYCTCISIITKRIIIEILNIKIMADKDKAIPPPDYTSIPVENQTSYGFDHSLLNPGHQAPASSSTYPNHQNHQNHQQPTNGYIQYQYTPGVIYLINNQPFVFTLDGRFLPCTVDQYPHMQHSHQQVINPPTHTRSLFPFSLLPNILFQNHPLFGIPLWKVMIYFLSFSMVFSGLFLGLFLGLRRR